MFSKFITDKAREFYLLKTLYSTKCTIFLSLRLELLKHKELICLILNK